MPSLADKLKSLGVKVGARDLPPPLPPKPSEVDSLLEGKEIETPLGQTYLVEKSIPLGYAHGEAAVQIDAPLAALSNWTGDPIVASLPAEAFLFLDTETTGLSGGTGTYAFLIGAGRFKGDQFHLAQFFMRDPLEEPAILTAFETFLAPCQAIVTFNGKAFDAPLLYTRFTTHGWRPPFLDLPHIDLLHLARRLWRDRLPSRSLMNLEWHILGTLRTEEDVPGWMIPSLYFDYLRSGDPEPLRHVFYHNRMDVVTLAVLMNHMAWLLADPLQAGKRYAVDLIALGRLFEDLHDLQAATQLYLHSLEHEDMLLERVPRNIMLEAVQRLAGIYKKQENLDAAVDLWQRAASYQHLEAYLELAKFYEHRQRDYTTALRWAEQAFALTEEAADASQLNPLQLRSCQEELSHRMKRLRSKLGPHE